MEWTQDLSVGVEEIDTQHKELIKRINMFFSAVEGGDDVSKVLSVLKFLEDYVVTHFSAEEALQQKSGYPEYAAHKKLHEGFIADIAQLKDEINAVGFTPATKMLMGTTLVSWLTLHIQKADKALGAYLSA